MQSRQAVPQIAPLQPRDVGSVMVEFFRLAGGGAMGMAISPYVPYIRTEGYSRPAVEIRPALTHKEFLDLLHPLRYPPRVTMTRIEQAQQDLARNALGFLPSTVEGSRELTQIDIVTNAAELWVFPFEACYGARPSWLASPDSGIIVTRRIRGEFSSSTPPWPRRPRVLFAYAPESSGISPALVSQHREVLKAALAPWSKGKKIGQDLLHEETIFSAQDLAEACRDSRASYVHLLAHGALVPPPPGERPTECWGLLLRHVESPQALAEALTPQDGVPLVVTIAACNSANQDPVGDDQGSFVQELHRLGIPVVIGSQLPLTEVGSVTLTSEFYGHLLRGEDVRRALHAARVALRQEPDARHDWLSLVAYVRLPPEGYGQHLFEFSLRAELGMLDAQQKRAELLAIEGGEAAEFDAVETNLRERLASLDRRLLTLNEDKKNLKDRKDLVEECNGLRASAYKRLAELLFIRSQTPAAHRPDDHKASRAALEASLLSYREAYRRSIHSHWLGGQMIALDAALNGHSCSKADWGFVRRAAEMTRDVEPGDFWSCGTLAEVWLLARIVDGPEPRLAEAKEALKERGRRAVGNEHEAFALESMRRQLGRYVKWWTNANGFFPNCPDLAKDAQELLDSVPPRE